MADPKEKLHTEPIRVRQRLAEAYRALSADDRQKPSDRMSFARMAAAWQATLPQSK